MLNEFFELEKQFNAKTINISNNFFNKILQKFEFTCLTKNNYENEINRRENEIKIITIDYYIDNIDANKREYFIFCVDNSLLILDISQATILKYFISHYSESKFYCVSENVIQYLEKNKNININYSTKNQFVFINNQIENFSYEFVIPKDYKKMNIIKKCLIGYLIKKSYYKSNINRLNQTVNTEIQIEKPNKTKNKYIMLNKFKGSSSVNLAYNIELEQLFIVKSHIHDSEQQKLLKRELDNYKKFNHPFLPKIYEDFIVNDTHYLVIEYINGETINNFDFKELKENEKMNILFEIMIAIHYIHSLGYIYRDLKDDNIIIDENNTAILIDLDRVIYSGNKIVYDNCSLNIENDSRAIEIQNNQPYTKKVDIYSLGFLIKEKFISKDNSDDTNTRLKTMVKYCLQKNPEDRPTISLLIRYFYLYILSSYETKSEINRKLIKIFEYNFKINNLFDPDGFCTLGMIYLQGHYIEQSKTKAIDYFTIGSNQNDLLSKMNLSIIYFDADVPGKAYHFLIDGSKQNDPCAQYILGMCFLLPLKFQQNIQKGIFYLNLASQQNLICADFYLSLIYFVHKTLKDTTKSIQYIQKIENYKKIDVPKNNDFFNYYKKYTLPNAEIFFHLDLNCNKIIPILSKIILITIFCSDKRYIKYAIDHLKKLSLENQLSKQNIFENNILKKHISNEILVHIEKYINVINFFIINANNIIGKLYMEGFLLPQDLSMAKKYFKSSLNQKNSYTYILLSFIYSFEMFNNVNIDKALKYYKLIDENSNDIFYKLRESINYLPKNPDVNFQNILFKQLYEFEILASLIPNNLGDLYFYGNCVKKDINKAIYFYSISADKKNHAALFKLGYIYFNGVGVKKNIEKAFNYFVKSATYGNEKSKFFLAVIFYGEKFKPKNINNSLKYFIEAAEEDVHAALFYLGVIYYRGIYIDRDLHKAIEYFINASNLNLSYAKNNYAIMVKNGDGIEKNIYFSIQILKEAINDNDDAARFNLAHIYFYSDEKEIYNLSKTIQLLLTPSLIPFKKGYILLFLAIIRKCTINNLLITSENIYNIIHEYNHNCTILFASKIWNEIISYKMNNLIEYQILYENIKKDELMYINHYGECTTRYLIESQYSKKRNSIINNSKYNINNDFYEGFEEGN